MVYIVVAAYNESAVIETVVRKLRSSYPHVVVVDDGSMDKTRELASKAGATTLRHPINRGQGAALQTGIAFSLKAGAEAVVTFDADGQHQVADIPVLLAPVLSGEADIVLGSRFLTGSAEIPALRRLLLKAAVLFTRISSGLPLTDAHNGLRAFSSAAATCIDIQSDRMAHASEIIDKIRRHRLRWVEVPVDVRYTRYSMAKGQKAGNALRIVFDYLFDRFF
jgi:glycosyltransferase involved in cell wall biosynthesis